MHSDDSFPLLFLDYSNIID